MNSHYDKMKSDLGIDEALALSEEDEPDQYICR
jgi:hypothetical protein